MGLSGVKGRRVIITGGAGGIGTVMTLALMDAGARVGALDISQENLNGLRAKIEAAGYSTHDLVTVRNDVTQPDDCQKAVERVAAAFGGIDMLVNNAGVAFRVIRDDYGANPIKSWEVAPNHWQTIMNINAFGPHLMGRAVIPMMLEAGRGKIVNVTTGMQNMIRFGAAVYGHSKAALEAQSSSWARELDGTGITVNVLEPGGAANTALIPPDPKIDRTKLVQPEVMGPPICWLASDQSDGVSGHRFVALEWDGAIDPCDAAEKIKAPIAWPSIGHAVNSPGSK